MSPFPSSGLGSSPYLLSSTTAATAACSNKRNLTFASEWYFKPEGVKLVKHRFEKELLEKSIKATPRWNEDDQTFQVNCLSEDVHLVWPMFCKVIVEIIKVESEKDGNYSENGASWSGNYEEDPPSDLIERLEIWQKELGIGIKQRSVQPQTEAYLGNVNKIAVSSYQELLGAQCAGQPATAATAPSEKLPEMTTWSVPPEVDLDQIASAHVLKELENLTGCQFVKVLNEHKIYIDSDFEENSSLAISKLDNLRKYSPVAPYMDHLFYSEGEENFQVVLKPFVDIKKAYFETTLLEHLRQPANCYENLSSAITVRIAPYNHSLCYYASVKNLHIVPAVNPEDKDRGITAWKEIKYNAKGELTELHRFFAIATRENDLALKHNLPAPLQPSPIQAISNRQKKDASIQRWANEIPCMSSRPLGHLVQDRGRSGGDESTSGSTNKCPDKPAWDTYKHFDDNPVLRKESIVRQQSVDLADRLSLLQVSAQSQRIRPAANGRPEAPSQARQPNPAMFATQATTLQSTPHTRGASQSPAWSRVARQPAQNNTAPTWPSSLPSSVQASRNQYTSENARPLVTPIRPTPAFVEARNDVFDDFLYPQPQRSILDEDISVMDYTDPLMQPIKWEGQVTDSQRPVHLGSERTQPLSEAATSSFHNTMNQRAPKKSKSKSNPFAGRLPGPSPNPAKTAPAIFTEIKVIDPLPEFIMEFNQSFALMMDRARGFRGQVEVEAEFGRVLLHNIHRKYITLRNSTENTFPTRDLQSKLLNAEPGFDTLFTKILTTSPGEIPYLLNLTDSDGKQLWDKKVSDLSVKYEFYFEDNAAFEKRRFIIQIDTETFVTQIKSWRSLGNIFIHGTGRHWDFRVAANGCDSSQGFDEQYGQLATAIELSLHVLIHLNALILFFELEEPMTERFELAGVQVRRICQYRSENTKSVLKISEIQSFDIQKFAVPGKPLTVFKLSPDPSTKRPFEKLGHWYEVSISCVQLDELLEENMKLQLGDETPWTVEDLLDAHIAQSLYLPACEMLKKMDGVGHHNHNGLDVRSSASTTASQVSQKPKIEFW